MTRGDLLLNEQDADDGRDDQVDEALAAMGLVLESKRQQPDRELFYLWPENVPLFNLWVCVQTQWARDFDGGRIGLSYHGVESYMRMARHPLRRDPETIEHLRRMELACLEEVARLRAGNQGRPLTAAS